MSNNNCTVCQHERQEEIDIDLVRRVPVRQIGDAYGLGFSAVQRHKQRHLSPALIATGKAQMEAGHRSILERLEELLDRCERYADDADGTGDLKLALAAVRELRATIELWGRATGELADRPQVAINLNTDPQIAKLEAIILEALRPYPDAAQAVARALSGHPDPPAIDA